MRDKRDKRNSEETENAENKRKLEPKMQILKEMKGRNILGTGTSLFKRGHLESMKELLDVEKNMAAATGMKRRGWKIKVRKFSSEENKRKKKNKQTVKKIR